MKLLTYILIILPLFSLGQNDKRFPPKDYYGSLAGECSPPYRLKSVEEVFKGYFYGTKIYLADYSHPTTCAHDFIYHPLIRVVDTGTGEEVLFTSLDAFNSFLSSARKPISNLDKAYLYLFLFNRIVETNESEVSKPYRYSKELAGTSIFMDSSLNKLFTDTHCMGCLSFLPTYPSGQDMLKKMRNEEANSSHSKIVVFTQEWSYRPHGIIHYRYVFNFSGRGGLNSVEKEEVSFPVDQARESDTSLQRYLEIFRPTK